MALVEALRRLIGDAGEHVGEPGLRVDVVHLGGDDQRVHGGGPVAAAVGAGIYPEFGTATKHMTRKGESFTPSVANQRIYDGLYRDVYLKMYSGLKPSYQAIKAVTDNASTN